MFVRSLAHTLTHPLTSAVARNPKPGPQNPDPARPGNFPDFLAGPVTWTELDCDNID